MENWVLILGAVVALILATTLLKTAVGLVIRYAIFVGLAGILYEAQTHGEVELISPEVLSELAIIGALSLVATLGIMAVLFRNSRFKLVLFPLVGFGTTFAAAAMVTQGG